MAEVPNQIGLAKSRIVAVDNGGSNTRVGEGREPTHPAVTYETPTDYPTAVRTLGEQVRTLMPQVEIVGVSIAGEVSEDGGSLVRAGQLQENGWCGKPLREDLADATGVKPEHVFLLNDCVAGAEAERAIRTQLGEEAGAFLTNSTGFGGSPWDRDGAHPDEPGHEFLRAGAKCGCGKDGCIEAHTSGSGIIRKFGVRGEHLPHTDPRWAEVKDDFQKGVYRTVERYRQIGIDPQILGFTGAVALGGPAMLRDLQQDLHRREGKRAPVVREAAYGENSGLQGAYEFALRQVAS